MKKLLSAVVAESMIAMLLTGLMPMGVYGAIETDLDKSGARLIYDASVTNSADDGYMGPLLSSNSNAINQAKALEYGITVDSLDGTTKIWNFINEAHERGFNIPSYRFAARANNLGTRVELGRFRFPSDTINEPIDFNSAKAGKYIFETDFMPIGRVASSGEDTCVDINFTGKKSGGEEAAIATLRFYQYANVPANGKAYFINPTTASSSATGTKLEKTETLSFKLASATIGTANASLSAQQVGYLKMEFDLEKGTYSAWLADMGSSKTAYEGKVTARKEAGLGSDLKLLIKDEPFANTGVTQFVGVEYHSIYRASDGGVRVINMSVSEKVASDIVADAMAALTFDKIKGGNYSENNIVTDLTLPTAFEGADVAWLAEYTAGGGDASSVIASDGTVNRPTDGNKNITLTATITRGGESDAKTFDVIVIADTSSDEDEIAEAAGLLESGIAGYPTIRAESFSLPTTVRTSNLKDVNVVWVATEGGSNVVVDGGNITVARSSEEDVNVTLTATLSYGSAEPDSSVTYSFIIPQALAVPDGSGGYTTTFDRAVDYSNGTLKAGSYIGYAHKQAINFSNLDEMNAAGFAKAINTSLAPVVKTENVTSTEVSLSNGLPTVRGDSGASRTVFYVPPVKDLNEINLPSGEGNNTYSVLQYSIGNNTSDVSGGWGVTVAGGMEMRYNYSNTGGTINMGGNTLAYGYHNGTTQAYKKIDEATVDGNDTYTLKLLQMAAVSRANYYVWYKQEPTNNPTDAPLALAADNVPAPWGGRASYVSDIAFLSAIYNRSITIRGVELYEQYELLLRDAVKAAEANMLSKKDDDLSNVKRDLNLPAEITDLDLNKNADITWMSSDLNVLTHSGTIVGTGTVTLTGRYTIDGKSKTIAYNVNVSEYTDEDAVVDAKEIIDGTIAGFVADNGGSDLDESSVLPVLPSSIPAAYGKTVDAAWSVTGLSGGAGAVMSDGAYGTVSITQSVKKSISVMFTASLSCGGAEDTASYPFVFTRKVGSDGNFVTVVNPMFSDFQVTGGLTLSMESPEFNGNPVSVTASPIAVLYNSLGEYKGAWLGDAVTVGVTQEDIDDSVLVKKSSAITINMAGANVEGTDVIKLFTWDSINGMQPFLAPVTVSH